jgi:AcrR family transcriptional regulator
MTTRTASRADIRDLILDGVDALLARFGYSKMTMADLARHVGIGKGTIYLHFPSKEELALAHVDRIAERVLARLRATAAQKGPADARLCSMLVDRVLVRFDSVADYSESLNDLLSSIRRQLLAHRQQHFERETEVLAGVIAAGTSAGLFERVDANETARALVWGTNAMLPFSLSARELGERREMEARVRAVARLLLHGLTKRRPGAHGAWKAVR